MPNPRLASRYAKALLELAIEKGQLEQLYLDMKWLGSVIKESRDFANLLRSPIINSDMKIRAITAATKDSLSLLAQQFNKLLIQKNREGFLPEIVTAFESQYRAYKNIHTVSLITATPITEKTRANIVSKVKRETGFQNIELNETIDPAIVGGFVLQLGDQMVDTSIADDLKEIARQFKNNDFIYKVR